LHIDLLFPESHIVRESPFDILIDNHLDSFDGFVKHMVAGFNLAFEVTDYLVALIEDV